MYKNGNVTVMVTDLKKAIEFYVETLGLKLQFEVEGQFAQVEAPGLTIGLHPGRRQGSWSDNGPMLSIGFEPLDFDSAFMALQSRGVEFHGIMDETETKIAPFSDPDGNPLYLIEVKPAAGVPGM